MTEKLAILDCGGQYTKVIDRKIREAGVYTDIFPMGVTADKLKGYGAIIFSGGPSSVWESGAPEYVVVGVGINAYAPEDGFPPELAEIAGSLWQSPVPDGKNKLAADFLNRFWTLYTAGDPSAFLEDYRRRSLVVGRDITVITGDTEIPAHALGIDDSCRLLVRYENGETAALSYGEVRIRA